MVEPVPARRRFLQAAALAASAALAWACAPVVTPTASLGTGATPTSAAPAPTGTPEATPVAQVARRPLGKLGVSLSVVGFGGIVVMDETEEAAAQYVSQAIARGVNYFDVAPSYGNAETRLGPALEPYRDGVFLACKTEARTRQAATDSLQRSLERLRTDRFDLYQLHAVTTAADVETILGPGGAIEAFQEARDKGQVKLLGFSAHTEEAALSLLDGFAFDTMLFPVNYVAWNTGKFGPKAVAAAQEHGVSILALKSLAKRQYDPGETKKWHKCWYSPVESPEEAALALRFTLTRPVVAAVSPSHAELLWWACDAAAHPQPLTAAEEGDLAKQAEGLVPVFPSH